MKKVNKIDLVSVVGAQAKPFITSKRPSDIIPFKGEFPLLFEGERRSFMTAISDTYLMSELPTRWRKIIRKGHQMYTMEQSFKQYLKSKGFSPEEFTEMTKGEKGDLLIDWMTGVSLDFTSLEIKI